MQLLVVMCEAEHVEPSVQTGREMTLLMRRVLRTAVSSVSSQIPKEIRKLVPHFFVGRLRLPFSMAWDAAVEALAELAGHNIDILWPILETNLTQAIAASTISRSHLVYPAIGQSLTCVCVCVCGHSCCYA
jgi:hypothetical protein